MDSWGRFITIIVAIILVLLLPLQYVAISHGETIDSIVTAHVKEFTDTARQQGYITLDMYEDLIQEIGGTDEPLYVSLEVAHPVSGKDVSETTFGDKMPDLTTETTSYIENDDSTNNTITSSKDEISSRATHTHTADCYAGHRHDGCVLSGNMTKKMIVYFSRSHDKSVAGEESCNITFNCETCKNQIFSYNSRYAISSYSYSNDVYSQTYLRCFNASGQISSVGGSYYGWENNRYGEYWYRSVMQCIGASLINYGLTLPLAEYHENGGGYNWGYYISAKSIPIVINFTPLQYVKSNNYGTVFSYPWTGCPYCGVYGQNYSCGQTQDEIITCNQVVTSIAATDPIQAVDLGGTMITTATATYLDGHTETIDCTSNLDSNVEGEQTVTLTYTGLVGNAKTTGSRTCSVDVTVRVPYKLTGLIVTPTSQDVTRYANPFFAVSATYDNGMSKEIIDFNILNFSNKILGEQNVTISYSENGITKTADASVTIKNLTTTCPICGTVYELDDQDTDNGCPTCRVTVVGIEATLSCITVAQGNPLPVIVQEIYVDGNRYPVNGWTSDYDSSRIGIQDVVISYQGFTDIIIVEVVYAKNICPICGRAYDLIDGVDEGCPYCKTEVVSISASPKNVTIEKHSTLPITVVATYKDGHTENIVDWSVDLVADTAGTFDVSVYYQSAVDHITVTVMDENQVICPYCGLDYVFSESPEGCPVCYYKIVGIEASLRNGGTQVPYRSNLNIELVAVYQDTHKGFISNGWTITGYQPEVLGIQTVTVHYMGFNTTLTIEVVNNPHVIICPAGHEYFLNEDGTDPGCPICTHETDREDAILYFDTTYTSDILETLYRDGIYYLEQGDYLTVTVTERGTSLRSKLQNLFYRRPDESKEQSYMSGGEVIS